MQKKTRRIIIATTLAVSFAVGYITAPEEPKVESKKEYKPRTNVEPEMANALKKQRQRMHDQWHYDRMFCAIVNFNEDLD